MDAQEAFARVRLASSILSWAEQETAIRSLVEARAALDGATIQQLIERRDIKNVVQGR